MISDWLLILIAFAGVWGVHQFFKFTFDMIERWHDSHRNPDRKEHMKRTHVALGITGVVAAIGAAALLSGVFTETAQANCQRNPTLPRCEPPQPPPPPPAPPPPSPRLRLRVRRVRARTGSQGTTTARRARRLPRHRWC